MNIAVLISFGVGLELTVSHFYSALGNFTASPLCYYDDFMRVFMIRKVLNQVLLTQKSKKLFWFSHRLAKGGKNERQIIRLDTEVNLKMGLLFHWVLLQVSSVLPTSLPFHWTKFTWESIKADCAFSETRAGPIMLASSDLALSTGSAAHQKSSLR